MRPATRSAGPGAVPNLFVIGALKAGTTSLHSYLDLHPAIGMSPVKELDFFVDQYNWGRGLAWYRSHFDPAYPIRGESSPMYSMRPGSERAAGRIRAIEPDARILYLVRDPIERSISHYEHARSVGIEHRPIAEAFADLDCDYVGFSRYRYQLETYLEHFGDERILVLSGEELQNSRRAALKAAFSFLGVDDSFDTPDFDREWMVTGSRGGGFRAARWLGVHLGLRAAWHRLPQDAKWAIINRLSRSTGQRQARPELDAGLRERLAEQLAPDAEQLRSLTGEKFPSWSV